MPIVVSPAKRLDWSEQSSDLTEPMFPAEALRLAKTARNLTLGDLRGLMGISDDLARLNRDRFKAFAADPSPEILRPAALAFAGDTYQGLDAASLSQSEIDFAQKHLRILSGLYGLLRPLDGIQPYRLEMGSRLKTRRGANLYAFWGKGIAKALRQEAEAVGSDLLVNCASQEYFGAVDEKALGLRVVTPVFLDEKQGVPKVISFFAKRARGAMARHLIQAGEVSEDAVAAFHLDGYVYDPAQSTAEAPVFCRKEQQAA